MEIRSLEIDFEKGILRINGKCVVDRPVVVTLPGCEDKMPLRRLFNSKLASGKLEDCDRLEVVYKGSQ